MVDANGHQTITNDGATVMRVSLDIALLFCLFYILYFIFYHMEFVLRISILYSS